MTMLVVAAALLDEEGRCLMQRRPAHKRHGDLWEFPGGKVESGEAPAAALVRELREELAIAVDPADATPLSFAADTTTAPSLVMLLYVVRRWTGVATPLAASALRWDRPAALAALPMPPVDVPLLAALRDSLARGAALS